MKRSLLIFLMQLLILSVSTSALARPEYAVREKLNCTSCHTNAWGGGPRMVFGKVYGAHGHVPGKLATNDVFYGDLRMIYYLPERPSENFNGLALMQASVAGNVPAIQDENGSELRAVMSFNMAPLSGSSVREAYLRWQLSGEESAERPTHFTIGRIYMPFGLLTDEHRTYTRIQTNMTINNYNLGGALSVNPLKDFHFDLALVNDFQSGGDFSRRDISWGGVVNLRWNPDSLPFLLGASANFQHSLRQPEPYASSLYGVFSLDRVTGNAVSGSLQFERVDAKNWNSPAINNGQLNPGLPGYFIPPGNAALQASLRESASVGYYGMVRYNLTTAWTLFYKFDYLALDRDFAGDAYARHGLGFEVYPNSNMILNVRFEKALGMRPDIQASDVIMAQDDVFAMLRFWL